MMSYVAPELMVLIPALYVLGKALKESELRDELIPGFLGLTGIVLAAMYVCGTTDFSALSLFTAITQGLLCAGCSVYFDQLVKQNKKLHDNEGET